MRPQNEDSYFAGNQIWAVADGMGGQAAGDVASRIVIDRLSERDQGGPLSESDLEPLLDSINAAIVAHGHANADARDLGSTVSGLAAVRLGAADHWAIFNIGDSRVYRFVAGALQQVTIDHNEVEEAVAAGRLDPEEARTHPSRHVLTRSLGSTPGPRADVVLLPQADDDVFLICSDGLTSEVAEPDIAAILGACPDPIWAVDQLVDLAIANGGHDNVTAMILQVVPAEGPASDLEEKTIPRSSPQGAL
ncbi:MAG: protein phosphatase 2C domain-containing protein [Propionibacteriaceae bacterium]|nr:protein phosphatase 2C domain-containing protein [Propionibacteriaceae bacterium]